MIQLYATMLIYSLLRPGLTYIDAKYIHKKINKSYLYYLVNGKDNVIGIYRLLLYFIPFYNLGLSFKAYEKIELDAIKVNKSLNGNNDITDKHFEELKKKFNIIGDDPIDYFEEEIYFDEDIDNQTTKTSNDLYNENENNNNNNNIDKKELKTKLEDLKSILLLSKEPIDNYIYRPLLDDGSLDKPKRISLTKDVSKNKNNKN